MTVVSAMIASISSVTKISGNVSGTPVFPSSDGRVALSAVPISGGATVRNGLSSSGVGSRAPHGTRGVPLTPFISRLKGLNDVVGSSISGYRRRVGGSEVVSLSGVATTTSVTNKTSIISTELLQSMKCVFRDQR